MNKMKLGKKEGTLERGNKFWIKKYDRGIKIKVKGEGEITLDVNNVFEILLFLRKYCKRDGFPILLTSLDLSYVWQKYPETQELIERLFLDEVTDDEKIKIHKFYMTKQKILESLK